MGHFEKFRLTGRLHLLPILTMKKLFSRLLGFGLFTSLVWLGIFAFCSTSYRFEYILVGHETNWGYVNQRSSEWASIEDHSEDILFFGSSTCYSSIDPAELEAFGLSGYNFCSSSQNIGNSAALIMAALSEVQPAFIALDVYPSNWGSENAGLECTRDWIINSNLRGSHWSKAYRATAFQTGDIFTMVSSVYYDLVRPWKPAGTNEFLAEDKYGIYAGRGFVQRIYPPLDSIECSKEQRTMSDFECNAILSIREICREKGVKLILIDPPQLCEETFDIPPCFDGIPLIEGNRWPGAKMPKNFYDDHHLVATGASGYSSWLAQKIANLN